MSGKWQTTLDCEMLSSPDTLQVLLGGFTSNGLEHSLVSCAFRPTWPCLIVEAFTTRAKFLQPSGYCTMINYIFNLFSQQMFLVASVALEPGSNSLNMFPDKRMSHVHPCSFQSIHGRNRCTFQRTKYHDTINPSCFGHVIYLPQTSTNQDITKHLIHPCKRTDNRFVFQPKLPQKLLY